MLCVLDRVLVSPRRLLLPLPTAHAQKAQVLFVGRMTSHTQGSARLIAGISSSLKFLLLLYLGNFIIINIFCSVLVAWRSCVLVPVPAPPHASVPRGLTPCVQLPTRPS